LEHKSPVMASKTINTAFYEIFPIRGNTKVVGVFGHPVTHSLSPAMHNAAFVALDLPFVYVPFPVVPDAIGPALRSLPALGIVGVNLTIPHKETALPFLDEITQEARRVGAVNTVHCVDGKLLGDNTDGRGFLQPLLEVIATGVSMRGQTVVVLGAGGAARSVVHTLVSEGAHVVLANRTQERAERLAWEVLRVQKATAENSAGYSNSSSSSSFSIGTPSVQVVTWDETPASQNEMTDALKRARVLVNTTRIGMVPESTGLPPIPLDALTPGLLVYDLVYNPIETRLLQEARRRGCETLTGVKMLVYQGAAAFERWTGVWPPTDIMEQAVLEGLRQKAKE
jgi:shikimate dehydrogenase